MSIGQLTVAEQTDLRTVNSYWGPTWGYRGMYPVPGVATQTTETVRYKVGTLTVDFFDAESHELVWRGTADGRLRDSCTPEQRQERADGRCRGS